MSPTPSSYLPLEGLVICSFSNVVQFYLISYNWVPWSRQVGDCHDDLVCTRRSMYVPLATDGHLIGNLRGFYRCKTALVAAFLDWCLPSSHTRTNLEIPCLRSLFLLARFLAFDVGEMPQVAKVGRGRNES